MQQFLFASAQNNNAAILIRDCLAQIGEIPTEANPGFLYASELNRRLGFTAFIKAGSF